MSWWGVPPAFISPPSTATPVSISAQGSATGHAAIDSTEVDYFSFQAPLSGAYRITVQTPTSDLDPVLGVFQESGRRIAENDDTPTSTDSALTVSLTAGAHYFMGITNYTAMPAGSYTWAIEGPASSAFRDDAFEENDTRSAASNLGTLNAARTYTSLRLADANDWYRFQTASAGSSPLSVTIDFANAQGNLSLELYNAAGTRIGVSRGTGNQERISLSGLGAGTYYVRVFGATNPNYSLTITPPSGSTATTIDLSGASLSAADAAQWGQAVTVQAAIRNSGNTTSPPFLVQWYLSRDTTVSSNDVLLSFSGGGTIHAHPALAANSLGASFSHTLQLPASLPAAWSGNTFYLVMRTDAAAQIAESNEQNNYGQVGDGFDRELITIGAATPPPVTPPTSTGGFQIEVVATGMTASQLAIFQQAADRWAQVIVGDLPNATYNGSVVDDLRIDASAIAIDGPGGILGQAGPDRFRANNGSGIRLPYHGIMEFDSADLANMQANGTLLAVIIHEMGHVLGVGTAWGNLLTGAGTSNPRFIGAQATAAYNQIFGRNETGVPVENSGGSGTRDAHWRESVFRNEIMTGYISSGVSPLSRITVGSLADIGYTVNMAAADQYTSPASSFTAAAVSSSSAATLRSRSNVAFAIVPGSATSPWLETRVPAEQPVEEIARVWREPIVRRLPISATAVDQIHTEGIDLSNPRCTRGSEPLDGTLADLALATPVNSRV